MKVDQVVTMCIQLLKKSHNANGSQTNARHASLSAVKWKHTACYDVDTAIEYNEELKSNIPRTTEEDSHTAAEVFDFSPLL